MATGFPVSRIFFDQTINQVTTPLFVITTAGNEFSGYGHDPEADDAIRDLIRNMRIEYLMHGKTQKLENAIKGNIPSHETFALIDTEAPFQPVRDDDMELIKSW